MRVLILAIHRHERWYAGALRGTTGFERAFQSVSKASLTGGFRLLTGSSIKSISGSASSAAQGFFAVMRKAEGVLPVTDLAAKALADQRFEIGLVIDAEDFDRIGHGGACGPAAVGSWRSCAFN